MLPQIRALLMDLDGVMFRGDTALPGAAEAIPRLRSLGIAYAFVTNNATLTPQQYVAKLAQMGVDVEAPDVVTSAEATAIYLRTLAPGPASVYVIGEEGLVQALQGAGFSLDDQDPTFVVVGLDRHVTYERLAKACLALGRGARLIATNADHAYPVEGGLWPGAGAILAAVVTATGVKPTVIGKPEPTIIRIALDRLGVSPNEAAMVGDQIDTDVRAGRAAGTATVLVEADLAHPVDNIAPDLTVRSLEELITLLEQRDSR